MQITVTNLSIYYHHPFNPFHPSFLPSSLLRAANNMASAVTSRGCARIFVLSVLYRCLECAQEMFERGDSVQFPFKETKVASWLQQAGKDCTDNKEFNELFGGTVYDPDDEASFWRQPHQVIFNGNL